MITIVLRLAKRGSQWSLIEADPYSNELGKLNAEILLNKRYPDHKEALIELTRESPFDSFKITSVEVF